jgi:transcriptional regulator with XRE-family HTH domain
MKCNLEAYLTLKSLSRKDLCAEAKISASYLTMLIEGSRVPNLATADRIARVLEVPVDVLWDFGE